MFSKIAFGAAAVALSCTTAIAQAPAPAAPAAQLADPAAAFGARPTVEDISMSPDGRRVAYVQPAPGQAARLFIADLTTGQAAVAAVADGQRQRLGGCDWVSNSRLVCSIFVIQDYEGRLTTVSRLIALDSDGRNIRQLGESDSAYQVYARLWGGTILDWLPGEDGAVLMGQQFVPEQREATRLERSEEGYGVVRVDTRTLARRRVETPRINADEYISDGRGRIRIMGTRGTVGATGQLSNEIKYMYRRAGSDSWQDLGTYNVLTGEGPDPLAVDRDLDAVYLFDTHNGRRALFRMSLDGSGRRELLVSHDVVDVDSLLRIGRSRRVIGASYVTDRRQAVMFDPALRTLSQQLSRAIPNLPLIRFVDSSEDESKLLIWAGSDTDPGRYFVYEKATRNLNEIMLVRPELENVRLASVRAISYRAADGTMIPAYLTLPPGSDGRGLPAIVLPHGGPHARDEWAFDWLPQYFANRGYAVLQPNFRGSAGYGNDWFQRNGFQSWRTAIGDVNDAGRWLVSEGIANPERLAILGWSYGGYAALQANVLDPALFKAAVAIAPVTDLTLLTEEARGWADSRMMRDYIGSGPHIRAGSPAQNAAAIRVPVLMFHGDRDANVNVAHAQLMRDRLQSAGRQVELVVFPGLDHQIEDSAARARMLRESDAFLRRTLGIE
jgi:dipeptidyl aminopeptidase/acylaminoacyl peptidase